MTRLEGASPRGPEAPFDLFWRHGDKKRIYEIAPEDDEDECWLEFATVAKLIPSRPPSGVSRPGDVNLNPWPPTVDFRILVEEGQVWVRSPSAFDGVNSADDLHHRAIRARVIVRHAESGKVVAAAWLRFSFVQDGDTYIPRMNLEPEA